MISVGMISVGILRWVVAALTAIACVILSGRVMAPLAQLTGLLGRMNSALSSYRALDEILGGVSEEEARTDQVERPSMEGSVEFRNVTFTYEG